MEEQASVEEHKATEGGGGVKFTASMCRHPKERHQLKCRILGNALRRLTDDELNKVCSGISFTCEIETMQDRRKFVSQLHANYMRLVFSRDYVNGKQSSEAIQREREIARKNQRIKEKSNGIVKGLTELLNRAFDGETGLCVGHENCNCQDDIAGMKEMLKRVCETAGLDEPIYLSHCKKN